MSILIASKYPQEIRLLTPNQYNSARIANLQGKRQIETAQLKVINNLIS